MTLQSTNKDYTFLSEEERGALEKFKVAVADLEQDEIVLIKFLRARELNVQNAEKMLRLSVTWKTENDVASYLHWTPPKFLEEFGFRFKFTGRDHEGRPVALLKANVCAKECIDAGHKEDMFKWSYHFLETTVNKIQESPGHQAVFILGAEDLSISRAFHFEGMQALYKIFQTLEQNYPETLKYCIIINAPWFISTFFNFLKPIFSARSLAKVHIFDSNKDKWMTFLTDVMPFNSIPEDYLDNCNEQ